jgi:hypothetical protein
MLILAPFLGGWYGAAGIRKEAEEGINETGQIVKEEENSIGSFEIFINFSSKLSFGETGCAKKYKYKRVRPNI